MPNITPHVAVSARLPSVIRATIIVLIAAGMLSFAYGITIIQGWNIYTVAAPALILFGTILYAFGTAIQNGTRILLVRSIQKRLNKLNRHVPEDWGVLAFEWAETSSRGEARIDRVRTGTRSAEQNEVLELHGSHKKNRTIIEVKTVMQKRHDSKPYLKLNVLKIHTEN